MHEKALLLKDPFPLEDAEAEEWMAKQGDLTKIERALAIVKTLERRLVEMDHIEISDRHNKSQSSEEISISW